MYSDVFGHGLHLAPNLLLTLFDALRRREYKEFAKRIGPLARGTGAFESGTCPEAQALPSLRLGGEGASQAYF